MNIIISLTSYHHLIIISLAAHIQCESEISPLLIALAFFSQQLSILVTIIRTLYMYISPFFAVQKNHTQCWRIVIT